jgi:hypothetical protein
MPGAILETGFVFEIMLMPISSHKEVKARDAVFL